MCLWIDYRDQNKVIGVMINDNSFTPLRNIVYVYFGHLNSCNELRFPHELNKISF
jgi:hypothetical protein